MGMAGAERPVALTTARCSRLDREVSALLLKMISGPPTASSMGRHDAGDADAGEPGQRGVLADLRAHVQAKLAVSSAGAGKACCQQRMCRHSCYQRGSRLPCA